MWYLKSTLHMKSGKTFIFKTSFFNDKKEVLKVRQELTETYIEVVKKQDHFGLDFETSSSTNFTGRVILVRGNFSFVTSVCDMSEVEMVRFEVRRTFCPKFLLKILPTSAVRR